MLKPILEATVRDIVENIERKQPHEDSYIELKGEWIPARDAARQLAAQANAARGEPIVWIFGVCKNRGVLGVEDQELSNWLAQLESYFDDRHTPRLNPAKLVRFGDKTVVALRFETDDPPYVVKTGASGGVEREVPWRAGTLTRTSKRSELLQLLVPLRSLPRLELFKAELRRKPREFEGQALYVLTTTIYVVPATGESITIPFQRASVLFRLNTALQHACQTTLEVVGTSMDPARGAWQPSIDDQIHFSRPGSLSIKSTFPDPLTDGLPPAIDATVTLEIAEVDFRPAVLRIWFEDPQKVGADTVWTMRRPEAAVRTQGA
jgi:hypothetical protein